MYADKYQSFYKLAFLFLMAVARHVQSTQNRKFIIVHFYKILKKSIAITFVFCYDAKHSDILQGSSHVRCYLFYQDLIPFYEKLICSEDFFKPPFSSFG